MLNPEYRAQFPALKHKSYFNYGGQGTLPQVALDAIAQSYDYIQTIGPFSLAVNNWITQEANLTRESIAQELGVPTTTITLTEDVTVGCNIVLWGIPWQAGDHILLSDCEHPGVIAAVGEICRRFGVTTSTFPVLGLAVDNSSPDTQGSPAEILASIDHHLQPQTRLVVLSHVLWNTGQILPLQEINQLCHERGCLVLIDAAQSVGQLPLDLLDLGVDFYAFTGHKWCCGPEGLGGLYVNAEVRDSLHPTFIGWRGITKEGWQSDGRRYEVATSAFPLYAGFRAAMNYHHQAGTAIDRYQNILHHSQYLYQKLTTIPQVQVTSPQPPTTGLVCFQIRANSRVNSNPNSDPNSHKLANHGSIVSTLEKQGVFTRTLVSPDCIRACVHHFTTTAEIDHLVDRLAQTIPN